MTILGIPPSSPANLDKRCPYLGLRDDLETALGFSSTWNCCHSVKPTATPNLEHQQNFCLTTKHVNCPAFHAEQKSSLPKDLRAPKFLERRKAVASRVVLVFILLFVIVSGLIFSGYWAPSWTEKLPVPGWVSRAMPVETEINTVAMVVETDTPVKNVNLDTPIVPTQIASLATQTEPVLIKHCAYPLETPFGTNRQFVFHQIANGESMVMLTERYETTASAIEAVNFFLPSPLWAELVIVIPLDTTDVDGLTSFRPVLIDEGDISLEELAQILSISSPDLIEFNQIDLSCRSFNGWMLIPAEKINP
ncbi:MAG: hypothetical protein HN392_11110 [Anaerolineae bacterium]|jgi:hypothetical protein|nr:hypothetical protein [Anaerolineae bacterium]MBT4311958.1 hypothetical protein [Anaerolineae bacterium]